MPADPAPSRSSSSVALVAQRYAGSAEELRLRLIDVDEELRQSSKNLALVQHEARQLRRQVTYWQGAAGSARESLQNLKREHEQLRESINYRGRNKRKVTVTGGYSLAKQRNIGHTSSQALVEVVAREEAFLGGLAHLVEGGSGNREPERQSKRG